MNFIEVGHHLGSSVYYQGQSYAVCARMAAKKPPRLTCQSRAIITRLDPLLKNAVS